LAEDIEKLHSPEEEADNARRAARYVRNLGAASIRAAAIGTVSQLAKIALGIG
jgi:hypothetical protein